MLRNKLRSCEVNRNGFIARAKHLHCDVVLPKWYPAEWRADVPLSTCQKIVRKNLNLYPYKITTLQELRPGDSERRLEYCNWFLNNLNDDRLLDISFFSDEAWVHLSGYCNNVSEAKVKGPIKLTGEKTGSRPFRDRNRKRRRRINFGTSVASDQQDSPFQDYISVSINIPSRLSIFSTPTTPSSRSTSTTQFSSRTTSWRHPSVKPNQGGSEPRLRRSYVGGYHTHSDELLLSTLEPPSAPLNHATSSKPERGVTSTRNIAPCAVQRPGKPPL
ncbi:hypothetical protein MTP99_004629 [Tenebrio molitor]|nr:hypothetical protein MTP99_004629 [Tenebrio molitor]